MGRRLLVLDTSYGYEAIVARQLQDSVTCRDLGGFFEHVWTVHPFGALVSEGGTRPFGAPETHRVASAHTFIDGKVGRFERLGPRSLPNFALCQVEMLLRLGGLIVKERIDVIRVGDPLFMGLFGLSLSRACRIPYVVRVNSNVDKHHELTGKPAYPRLFRSVAAEKAVLRLVLSQADLVAAVNQDNLDFALANGARPDTSTIFRYGNLIDKRHLVPPEERDRTWGPLEEFWPAPVQFLVHVGRLQPIKCPDAPIRALAVVREQGHDVHLLMVGDGDLRGELEELARALGVFERVVFAGNREQGWLAHVLPLASAVLSPITGRALTEAAFAGTPVVAYDLDWQGELIREGQTGILVPAHDWRAMGNGVVRILDDPMEARALGSSLRRAAFEMLDPATLDDHERRQYELLFARRAR